ncbi:MAG: IS5 family transposase [Thermoplasmata archaeon]
MARRWGRSRPDHRDWPTYNEQLVVRGEFFLDLGPFRQWKEELARLNRGKRGGQWRFPPSFVRWLVIWKQFLDYRSLEGLTRRLSALGLIPDAADYTTLWHRLHGLTPEVKLPKYTELELASDGTGLKTNNAGEYRIFRYGDPDARQRKHLVVVITADVRRKKVIGIEAHIEGKGHSESRTAAAHLRAVVDSGHPVRRFYGDGAYDTNAFYQALHEMGTEPVVKVRRNATAGAHHSYRSSKYRRRAAREYRRLGYRGWAESKGYGMRWPGTEGIFSAMKRKFGESVVSRSAAGLAAEGYQRVWAYDVLREYGEGRSPTRPEGRIEG